MSRGRVARAIAWVTASGALLACRPQPRPERVALDPTLSALRAFEAGLRADSADPRADLGPDPYALVVVGGAVVGLLRGASAIVVLDRNLHEIARADAGPLADALAATPDGTILVGSEASGKLRRFTIEDGSPGPRLVEHPSLDVHAAGVRALAVHSSGTVYALDEANDALFVASPSGVAPPTRVAVAEGPFRLAVTEHSLVALSLIGHAITHFSLAPDGAIRGPATVIRHDGPFWGLAASERGGTLLVAAGGVENHPLDRSGGSFGYIDSYVFLYRAKGTGLEEVGQINVGEQGVVTPKALTFLSSGALRVAGYGSDAMVDIEGGFEGSPPSIHRLPSRAGIAAMTEVEPGVVTAADPLLDAWLTSSPDGWVAADVPGPTTNRSTASKLGEALVFTTLMSPWAKTEKELSRFTCETCHFEGTTDGRTHYTGREDVHATTKPLTGLFVNEPHFSRALDEDMATMIGAEFRVASSNTGHSPLFGLEDVTASPALPSGSSALFTELPRDLDGSPLGLRKALMEFLRDFAPPKNASTLGRARFERSERRGATVFRELCVSCHAARLVANDPHTDEPFEAWEGEIFGGDRIVWARDGREMTGIVPYVHREGARPTSLRRLARKRPYFTNGSSPTVGDVLRRVWVTPDGVLHARGDDPPPGRALSDEEARSLEAFLRLL